MENEEILRKLNLLEQHVINLIIPMQNILEKLEGNEYLTKLNKILSQPIQVDDRGFENILKKVNQSLEKVQEFDKNLQKACLAMELKSFYERFERFEDQIDTLRVSVQTLSRVFKDKIKVDVNIIDRAPTKKKKPVKKRKLP